MKSTKPNGYLSITDYPLLPFYAVMCGVYVLLGKKKYLKNILFIINNIRAGVVTGLLSVLERDPEAPVLDRRSHFPGDGGEGDVHL